MTRLNEQQGGSGGGQSRSSPSDNYLSIEQLLQSHNDLILAIHKSFNESNAHINRNIVSRYKFKVVINLKFQANLADELRQVKAFVHSVVSDRSLKEELANWRTNTES